MIAQTNRVTLCPICHTSNGSDARFCQKCGNNIWLNDRYRIVRAIKEGGMGAVYEALDEQGKRYALKALIDRFVDPAERKDAIDRFQEEASILRELKHPQIPRVYKDFIHGGRYYLAMDFVEGDDLEDLLTRQPNGRFDEPTVLRWANQIADVLDYLHERRLIYRDMKPSNVMIERVGTNVKLVDFGIAKLFQPNERGTLIGTPGYSPPEQYQGQATPQSDVFALGATLHHLLTGRDPRDEAPFSFPPVRELAPAVSLATEQAITKALAMESSKRWLSAAAFRAALPLEMIAPRRKPGPQATVTLPSAVAPKVAPVPQPQRGHVAPPAAKPQPVTKPRAAKPARPAPQSQPAKPIRWWAALLIMLAVSAAIVLGQPGMSEKIGLLDTPMPTSTSAAPSLRLHQYVKKLTVTTPAAASTAEVRSAFVNAYEQEARAAYGVQTKLNPSTPLGYEGEPIVINEDAGQKTWEATLSGYIYAPSK